MSMRTSRTPVLPLGALPRVDLLPPSELRRRDMLARARTWFYVGIGALAVALLAVGCAFAYNTAAAVRLGLEQARTQQILVGIADLSDVSRAISLRSELSRTGEVAMAGDLEWMRVVAVVGTRLPPGVSMIDYALVAGAVPEDGAEPSAAAGASGTITVTSIEPLGFVELSRRLRDVASVQLTEVDELTSEDDNGLYEYRIRFRIDQSVYTAPQVEEEE
jgi:hypothetical protein